MSGSKQAIIVVAEDDELMREIIGMMLEGIGAAVLMASDGDQCLSLFRENSETVDLVVVDFSMPGRDGYQCCKEILDSSASVKCIVISGLPVTSEVKALQAQGRIGFLSKPFSQDALLQMVAEMLNKD